MSILKNRLLLMLLLAGFGKLAAANINDGPSSSGERGHLAYLDRWDRESGGARDNEIGIDRPGRASGGHRSQQEYVCGRAVANKQFRDVLMRDANYQVSVARAKYRPIEIRMPRIIGGDDTTPGEFPWTASIKLNGQPICGGSLIASNWILTAAHCVVGYNPKNLTVRLGAYRIKDTSETQTLDLPVAMFVVHKDYSMPRPFSNDIAMLKLAERVEYTDFIIPICLPTEDQLTTTTTSTASQTSPGGSSLALNEYTRGSFEKSSSKGTGGEDIGGIVISTKMSDHEIAKCFNKLEQNYLNSIGLGAIAEAASTGASTATNTIDKQQQQQTQAASMQDPLMGAAGQVDNSKISLQLTNKPTLSFAPLAAAGSSRPTITINHNHFDPTVVDMINPSQQDVYDDSYFGSPWNRRAQHAGAERRQPAPPPVPALKLSRLPISKELLREIQSIGSVAMPSLVELGHGNEAAAGASPEFVATLMSGATGELSSSKPAELSAPAAQEATNNNNSRGRYGSSYEYIASATRLAAAENNAADNDEDNFVAPINTDDTSGRYSGLSGTVVGWGWIRELDGDDQVNHKGYPSVTLQKVKLPILRNHVCESWFQSQAKKITLLSSQFCAGFNSGGKDACRGDSGGPMIIEDSSDTGRFKLIGIVSAGIGCARPSLPGLYTRVASFLPWINAQMNRY